MLAQHGSPQKWFATPGGLQTTLGKRQKNLPRNLLAITARRLFP
jgi:hypothetical protein